MDWVIGSLGNDVEAVHIRLVILFSHHLSALS